jgi:preprotein translocase subunit SecD
VAIHLSADASMKLATATARHRGRPIALILDGEVAAVLTVQNPMQADVVFGKFTPAEATRVARGLERW